MLSYRHGFHAGNFADVLKHNVLIRCFVHMSKKDKPFFYLDTHAGPGRFKLTTPHALKNREFEGGIGRLWGCQDIPELLNDYIKLVQRFNRSEQLTDYPGSPAIAKQFLRAGDRFCWFELHSSEIVLLESLGKNNPRIQVFNEDGFKGALRLLPPMERRGLVLIDPSYEMKSDYQQVVDILRAMYKRFATGIYLLWYPVVDRSRNKRLELAIQNSGINNVQLFELAVQADHQYHGMTGSGMIVINPPFTLTEDMRQLLPWLVQRLGENQAASYRIERLVDE